MHRKIKPSLWNEHLEMAKDADTLSVGGDDTYIIVVRKGLIEVVSGQTCTWRSRYTHSYES